MVDLSGFCLPTEQTRQDDDVPSSRELQLVRAEKNGKKFVRNSLYSLHFFPLLPPLLLVLFFRPIDSDVQIFLSRPLLAASRRPVK